MIFKSQRIKTEEGAILIHMIIFTAISLYVLGGLSSWVVVSVLAGGNVLHREQAIHIAEAGIDYYRWRLAHSPQDFQDEPGPITKDFYDRNGNLAGQYTITITPPPLGGTLVTVNSNGHISESENVKRDITVRMAKSSLAKFAVVANADIRFGAGTEVFGLLHSNGGIRFDGVGHNLISSSQNTYVDHDYDAGCEPGTSNVTKWAVNTCVDPQDPFPPTPLPPSHPDVFTAGRAVSVPQVDFQGITSNLVEMKNAAQDEGYFRGDSSDEGYRLVLKSNDTFDLYRINNLRNPPEGCSVSSQPGWGTWSIGTGSGDQTQIESNHAFPQNGVIYLEDNLWIEGQINGAALLIIAAADFPNNNMSVTINNDLIYTNYDGSDVIGIIAQNNINIGLYSKNDIKIEGALVAQNGRVGRYSYPSQCGSSRYRNTITLFGMIATNQRYGFAYTGNSHPCGLVGNGYCYRNINYDANLLYNPPPLFPLTTDEYTTLSWEEE